MTDDDRILGLLKENKELRAALEGQRESQLHRLQHARLGSMGYAEIEEELAEIDAALAARDSAPSCRAHPDWESA